MTFLVTGASGQQGGALARALLDRGAKIRVLTRSAEHVEDLEKRGAEVIEGDLDDLDTVRRALDGVEGAFLVTTSAEAGPQAEIRQGENFLKIAEEVGLPHLLYSSVSKADEGSSVPVFDCKWQTEQKLHKSSIGWTILRPVWFMDNFGGWMYPSLEQGTLALPVRADQQMPMIAVEDIGAVSAEILLNPGRFSGQTIELSSDALTLEDAMQRVSEACGHKIGYMALTPEQAEAGFGPEMWALFGPMFLWIESVGWDHDPNLSEELGLPLTTFDTHLATAPWLKRLSTIKT